MTRKCVTDEQFGQLSRRLGELKRRVDEGAVPFERAMSDVQALVEGKTFLCYLVDCDADPFLPEGWKVESHRKQGQLEWDPTKVYLHLSENQKNGKRIRGHELRKELANEPVLNANVLDFLLAHPELIPEEWKGKYVFFWGTVYRDSGGHLYIRCLCWDGGRWYWDYRWLDCGWRGDHPAACSQVSS